MRLNIPNGILTTTSSIFSYKDIIEKEMEFLDKKGN